MNRETIVADQSSELRYVFLVASLLPVFTVTSCSVAQTTSVSQTTSQKLPNQELVQNSPSPSQSTLTLPVKFEELAQAPAMANVQQGQEIALNGQKFPVAWSQWQQGKSVQTGISDIGAMKTLGVELLSTNSYSIQPIQWFSEGALRSLTLEARLINPYRYLDITELAAMAGWQMQVQGNTLTINSAPTRINNIRVGNQVWGKRIVLDLERPTFWQVSQTKAQGVVTLDGVALPTVLKQFQPQPTLPKRRGANESLSQPHSKDNKSDEQCSSVQCLLTIETSGTQNSAGGGAGSVPSQAQTKLHINLPEGKGLQVFSLPNPNRLVIDIRAAPLVERDILWAPGIRWHQQFIAVSTAEQFPVTWLEVDSRSPNISLKPITSNAQARTGIAPLVSTARSLQAAAAINGGFFNRKNQLPLGAIRQDGRWLSGPILNRGAIAWNESGSVKIGRLSLQEVLTTATGDRLPVLFLNSGYVQGGLARYTPEWGSTYTPLTDKETIVIVQNQRVTQQIQADLAGKNSFVIPPNGYLLAIRANSIPPSTLNVGTQVTIESITVPSDYESYSQIIGAGPLLLQNRQIVLDPIGEQFSEAFNRQAASRSAIATTNRGTLIIAAVHSGINGKGPTLTELAQIMQQLGAIDALNFDGGSSTSFYLGGQLIDRSPTTAARVHNGLGIFMRSPRL